MAKHQEILGELSDALTTQAKLARYLNVSKAYITQLADEGNILVRDEESGKIYAFDSLKNYLLIKKSGNEGVNYFKEKGLHERVKREQGEIKLEQMRGNVYQAEDIENAWAELMIILRNNLLGLPAKVSAQLENRPKEEISYILNGEIEAMLKELSESKT